MSRSESATADEARVSEKFNSQDAEVVFQSSDGIQFRIHRLNLSVSSEGFSPPDQATFDDVTLLSETSSTLDLLFRFMYPEPQPDLERLEFEALALLAEAAEKYQVYSAINTSTINLIKRLPNHATEVLLHALKHGKCALLARVAPLLLDCRLEDILPLLPDHHIIPWVKYHAQWSNVWKRLISPDEVRQLPRTACAGCGRMPNDRVVEAMDNLSTTISSVLQDLQSLFPKCSGCSELPAFSTWKQALEERIQKLPSTTEIFLARKLAPFQEPSSTTETPLAAISFGSDTDLIFVTKDGVSFNVHRKNVHVFTKNLLPSRYDSLTPIPIPIPELSLTMKAVFNFIYPQPHPDLGSCDFLNLELIAAAAEKYQIYPAIAVTGIRLRDGLSINMKSRPAVVMWHAVRTKNGALMDEVAPFLIGHSLFETIKIFEPAMVSAWIDYYERWKTIARNALQFASQRQVSKTSVKVLNVVSQTTTATATTPTPTPKYRNRNVRGCNSCSEPSDDVTISILRKLGNGVQSLQNLDDTFSILKCCCDTSKGDVTNWRSTVQQAIQALPTFSSLAGISNE